MMEKTEMSEWQDIRTAPKDGTRFLACNPYDQFICNWGSHYMRYIGGKDVMGWVRSDGPLGNTAHPTFWMPLRAIPKPPSQTTNNDNGEE